MKVDLYLNGLFWRTEHVRPTEKAVSFYVAEDIMVGDRTSIASKPVGYHTIRFEIVDVAVRTTPIWYGVRAYAIDPMVCVNMDGELRCHEDFTLRQVCSEYGARPLAKEAQRREQKRLSEETKEPAENQ